MATPTMVCGGSSIVPTIFLKALATRDRQIFARWIRPSGGHISNIATQVRIAQSLFDSASPICASSTMYKAEMHRDLLKNRALKLPCAAL
ncbi:hypothetical protein [Agrobacterium tumefaciens]|uniref:hypothetical protein n=1 Tax=Agrobacterium tumefaciens TaxID=358 RepID=UPI0022440482|nr:hypothetical protein [Agrobacterium tumefaciens]MCW8060186.1 hypothetical protein [Agrobacterium tumefaciens]